jgi:hypothetical protein
MAEQSADDAGLVARYGELIIIAALLRSCCEQDRSIRV